MSTHTKTDKRRHQRTLAARLRAKGPKRASGSRQGTIGHGAAAGGAGGSGG